MEDKIFCFLEAILDEHLLEQRRTWLGIEEVCFLCAGGLDSSWAAYVQNRLVCVYTSRHSERSQKIHNE